MLYILSLFTGIHGAVFVKKKSLTEFVSLCILVKVDVKRFYFTEVMRMEKMVRQALLFDFYGELLTEHQKNIYSDIVLDDLSYSEVARDEGISRQGVYDLVKRCDKILEDYESKLRLVEKFLDTKERVSQIHDLATELKGMTDKEELQEKLNEIEEISKAIYESY